MSICFGHCESKKQETKNCDPRNCHNTYDFIIVGAGQAGSVLANRLSENGKFSVLVLETGRDDARLPEKLPVPSSANVPQPGDFHWGGYERGPANFVGTQLSRGFSSFRFYQKNRDDPKSRTISYPRCSAWGGCTSHNATVAIRNGPWNWDKWAAMGLPEWSFNNILPFYKLVENRSQMNAAGQRYYDPAIPEPQQGSFNDTYYGFNGQVPLFHPLSTPFEAQINIAVTQALNTPGPNAFGPGGFNYPLTVDLDYPPTAAQGGTSLFNVTSTDQTGSIVPPAQTQYVPFAQYNQPLYGDNGWVIPPEFQTLNVPIPVTPITLPGFPQLSGLSATQRANAANTYLYPAQSNKRLTIRSEVFVTQLITSGKGRKLKTIGVKYLENGYNVYQTGRNNRIETGGFGGASGDARANSILAERRGTKQVYARKEVILCAGVYNTPQLLMLSGIGNRSDLRRIGIKIIKHLPGVGQSFIENQELFFFFQIQNNRPPGNIALAAKSKPSLPITNFDLNWGAASDGMTEETEDPFTQKTWGGLKNLGGEHYEFARNTPNNLLNSGE
ncbi:MAG TPA: GMC family oxidoreductase N-terminal domain-containing protein, partial [Anaerovoracaceae bacterium]|nr:GMC family oxidoreductase N-terminal domain-containing protein [Anaerovoracaceae bacterium]